MKLVIFGLTISSSWGNGHATIWRGLCRALSSHGHEVVFFERDVPYYAAHRDLWQLPSGKLLLFGHWDDIRAAAGRELSDADVALVTSYCPDAIAASELVLSSVVPVKAFYDLDTPVTLERLRKGEQPAYIGPRGLRDFDLVLSYTGGVALQRLQTQLGARWTEPLYGSVDPATHFPVVANESFRSDLSYLGTYAADRQPALNRLLIEPARQLADKKFIIAGAQYPPDFPWAQNIFFLRHLPPGDHPVFFCSSRLTLNVTRQAMVEMGYCPSGRLFEAAACGTPILSDWWEGLDQFFSPGQQIIIGRSGHDAASAIQLSSGELSRIAVAARERVLEEHTADARARQLEAILQRASKSQPKPEPVEV